MLWFLQHFGNDQEGEETFPDWLFSTATPTKAHKYQPPVLASMAVSCCGDWMPCWHA